MNNRVVYTCITGGYDRLREPKYVSMSVDYVCFTDNAKLTSKFWKIRQIPSDLKNLTDVKKQRMIKVLPHKYLSEYSESLWIDSNIELIGDVKDFFNKYDLSKKFLYTNIHPSRDCIYREHVAVLRMNKDTYENTNPQINRYRDEGFPEHYGLAETNIMLRAHKNPKCVKLMNLWGEEILKGSHRDQLSFNYAIWKLGCKDCVEYLDEKYYNLHLCDNSFFKLAAHLKTDDFERFKTIDTNPPPEPEPDPKPEQQKEKQPEEIIPSKIDKSKELLLPFVSVVIFTHNRTHVAKAVLQSLVKNIVYPKLKWIISDDRSNPGHVEELCETLRQFGIAPITRRTNNEHWGLGASMNNGLKEAFKYSDIVLRTEDDWYLEKKLYLEKMVDLLEKNKETAGIRLAMVGKGVGTDNKIMLEKGFKSLVGGNGWIFNNQVMLVHKRTHDLLGWYTENTDADKEETDFKDKFNVKTDSGKKNLHVFCPSSMKWGTLDDPSLWFIHVGRSTLGHEIYREPKRYSWIYKINDPEKIKEIKENRKEEQRILDNKAIEKILNVEKKNIQSQQKTHIEKPIVGVIITTHNRTHIAKATIKSLIDNLKYSGNLKWCIADDRSNHGHVETLCNVFSSNGINDVFICTTDKNNFGLGASLNNGLRKLFDYTDIVLTTEDDWFLQKELNLDKYVKDIKEKDIAQIRFGSVNYRPNSLIHFSYLDGYNKLLIDGKTNSRRLTINLQVCLRHKRCYDRLGYYDTNINSDIVEINFNKKYEAYVRKHPEKLLILAPSNLITNTLDSKDNWFVHIGPSTIGHTQFQIPLRYKVIDNKIDYRTFIFKNHKDVLNICLITDENYVIPTMVLIQSIHNHSGFKNIRKTNIYVLGVRLKDNSKKAFEDLNRSLYRDNLVETNIIVKDVSEKIIERSLLVYKTCHPNKHSVGSSTLIKFNIWNILSEIDECLYIDTDIICERNLFDIQNFFTKKNEELQKRIGKNYLIGAVPISNHHIKYTLNRYPLGSNITFARIKPYYFNAGVMYLNLKELRLGKYTDILFDTKLSIAKNESVLKYEEHKVKCTGCDQDTFNSVFDSNKKEELCLILPFEFNVNAIEFPWELPALKLNYGNFELFKHLCINDYTTLEESLNDGYLYHFTLNKLKPWKLKSYKENKNIDRFIKMWWKEFETIDKKVFNSLTKEQMTVLCGN